MSMPSGATSIDTSSLDVISVYDKKLLFVNDYATKLVSTTQSLANCYMVAVYTITMFVQAVYRATCAERRSLQT